MSCPICNAERYRFIYASPAGEDSYARAAELPPESPITTYYCLSCGAIFNSPRLIGGLAKNVYEKNLATHPHGVFNCQGIFNVPWAKKLKPSVSKAIARCIGRSLKDSNNGRVGLGRVLRQIFKRGSPPLNLRVEQDFSILEELLGKGGNPPFQPKEVLTLGCPFMAFIPLALQRRFNSRLSYFVAFEETYWGKACKINGTDCLRAFDGFSSGTRIEAWHMLALYDFIYVANCLDHVYELASCLRRIREHLKPGGLVCVQNHMFFERRKRLGRFPAQHSVVFTKRSWSNLLRFVGYEQLGLAFDENDFYALLRPMETSGSIEEPPIAEFEDVVARLKAIACKGPSPAMPVPEE